MKLESCAYRDGKYGDWGEDGFFLNCSFQSSAYIWLEENRNWKWNVTAVWVVGPTEWQPNWPSAECPVCRIVPSSLLVRDYKQWLVTIFCTKEQNQKSFWSTRLEDLQMLYLGFDIDEDSRVWVLWIYLDIGYSNVRVCQDILKRPKV